MCGICGIYHFDLSRDCPTRSDLNNKIDRMLAALAHRGTYSGKIIDPDLPLAIGMRRLPIVDSRNRFTVPLANERGDIFLSANGEIYNSGELLAQAPRPLSRPPRSDLEAILTLYEKQGIDCLALLQGMFALAIWDKRKKRLLLVRDQAGVKPLFYLERNGTLYFSSEIKALKAVCAPLSINHAALYDYLCLQYIPQPKTIYKEIQALPPGEYIIVENQQFSRAAYWRSHPAGTDSGKSPSELAEQTEQLLAANIKSALATDQPLGILLSGGVDSSLLTVLGARHHPAPLHTYSAAFTEASFDDTAAAVRVAQKVKSIHHRITIDQDKVFAALPEVIAGLDQPFAEGSFVPYELICREAKKDVRVLLAGEGADELFGGYEIYRALLWKRLLDRLPPGLTDRLRNLVARLPVSRDKVSLDFKLKRFFEGLGVSEVYAHLFWRRAFSEAEISRFCRPEFITQARTQETAFPQAQRLFNETALADSLAGHLYLDQQISLVSDLLYRADLISMRHTLEVRVPFLQKELIEQSQTIPTLLKFNLFQDKILFRRIAKKYLPSDLAEKRKKGFNIPYSAWLATSQGQALLREHLTGNNHLQSIMENLIIPAEMMRDHQRGAKDYGHPLWTLLILAMWNKKEGYVV